VGGGWGGSSSHTGEAVPSCAASTRVWSLCCFAVAARGIEDRATVRALRFCPRPSVDKDCEADAGHHRHERKDIRPMVGGSPAAATCYRPLSKTFHAF